MVRLIQLLFLINTAEHSPETHNTFKLLQNTCSECRFHSNKKAMLHKVVTEYSRNRLLVHHLWPMRKAFHLFLLMISNSYREVQICSIAHIITCSHKGYHVLK